MDAVLLIVMLLTAENNLVWEARKLPDMEHCQKAAERVAPRFPEQAKVICVPITQMPAAPGAPSHNGIHDPTVPPAGRGGKHNT